MQIPIQDCLGENLAAYFDEAIEFIGELLSSPFRLFPSPPLLSSSLFLLLNSQRKLSATNGAAWCTAAPASAAASPSPWPTSCRNSLCPSIGTLSSNSQFEMTWNWTQKTDCIEIFHPLFHPFFVHCFIHCSNHCSNQFSDYLSLVLFTFYSFFHLFIVQYSNFSQQRLHILNLDRVWKRMQFKWIIFFHFSFFKLKKKKFSIFSNLKKFYLSVKFLLITFLLIMFDFFLRIAPMTLSRAKRPTFRPTLTLWASSSSLNADSTSIPPRVVHAASPRAPTKAFPGPPSSPNSPRRQQPARQQRRRPITPTWRSPIPAPPIIIVHDTAPHPIPGWGGEGG